MKLKHFIIYILLSFICIKTEAQKFLNQGCYWPPLAPNPAVSRASSDETSEDWWYDFKAVPSTHPSYAPGRYICAGYSNFDDTGLLGLYANNPCHLYNDIATTTIPFNQSNFDLPDMRHLSNSSATIGLVNLTRTSSPANPNVWIYNFGKGTYFGKVIPTSDGGFLATGASTNFNVNYISSLLPLQQPETQYRDFINANITNPNPAAIYYQSPSSTTGNPSQKNTFNFPDCPPFPASDPEGTGFKRHACLVKVDQNGKLQWFYTYGIVQHDGINGDLAYKNSTAGTDLVETDNGYILSGILQNSVSNGNYANHAFLSKVDYNGNLIWIKQYSDNGFVAEKFSAIRLLNDTIAYVSGERTYNVGFPPGSSFCTPPSGSPISSACINRSFVADLEHAQSLKFLSFIKKIKISDGTVIWDVSLTSDPLIDSRIRNIDIALNGNILAAVSDQCTVSFPNGECQNTYVVKVADNVTSGSILPNPTSFGSMRAYDLNTSLGVVATTDGGFIVVGTKKAYDINIAKDYSSPVNGGGGYDMRNFDQKYSQTDAFVAKCNAAGNIEWTSIFDNKASGGGGNIFTYNGNPRSQTNLDNWMNFTTTRSKKDIKRQECLYSITTSADGEIIIGGNMSSNIDDSYLAMVENTCDLSLSNNLIQSINPLNGAPVKITNMNNFVASNVNLGRIPGNTNEIAEFIVNKGAVITIEAGQEINMYDGTDLSEDLDPLTDVDAYINPLHTCNAGPVYSFYNNAQPFNRNMTVSKNKNVIPVHVKSQITVSPNPTTGLVLIKHPSGIKQLQVFDLYGKEIFKINANGTGQTNVDFSHNPAGMYLLKMEGADQMIKIIKH
jgi:hypothetical protein